MLNTAKKIQGKGESGAVHLNVLKSIFGFVRLCWKSLHVLGAPAPSLIFALFPLSKRSIIKAHDCKNTTLHEKKHGSSMFCKSLFLIHFQNAIFKTPATGKKSGLSKSFKKLETWIQTYIWHC